MSLIAFLIDSTTSCAFIQDFYNFDIVFKLLIFLCQTVPKPFTASPIEISSILQLLDHSTVKKSPPREDVCPFEICAFSISSYNPSR